MAEKPILFNTQMVQAIQAGLKTQTRRIIKGLPLYEPFFEEDEGRGWLEDKGNGSFYALEAFSKVQPGDVLWVRETWNYGYIESSDREGAKEDWFEPCDRKTAEGLLKALSRYMYKADRDDDELMEELQGFWRPSIHMPREAARIFLRVTGLRAERLQSITIEEIKAEGLTSAAVHAGDKEIAFAEFKLLWNSTIKTDDLPRYGWDANPWVWVYEFEKMEAQHG